MTLPILIPLFPLLAGLLIWVYGNRMPNHVAKVGIIATSISCLISAWTLYYVSNEGTVRFVFWTLSSEGSAILKIGMLVDRLTATMMMLITSVSVVIHVYSVRYLEGDNGYVRFLGY